MRNLTMKTKLLVLLGIALAVISAFAVAGNLVTSPWSTDPSQVQTTPATSTKNTTDDVSALLPSLQGIPAEESAYLDDDKAIYVSRPNDLNEKTSRRKVANNAEHIFGQYGPKVLFAKTFGSNEEVGWHGDLWILGTQTGKETLVSDSISDAVLSPMGKFIAASNPLTGGIDLYSGDGIFLKKIGVYGVGAVFSSDNKLIAYTKLAKFTRSPFDIGAPGNILGVFVYNLETGDESVVVADERDSGPITFSFDNKKLYFDSSRSLGEISLWVADLASLKIKQLTNKGHVAGTAFTEPRVFSNPILSSDGKVMVSAWEGEGVGVIIFNSNGEVSSSKRIKNGTEPRWLVKDSIIAYRATGIKGKYWEFAYITK